MAGAEAPGPERDGAPRALHGARSQRERCAWFDADACWTVAAALRMTLLDIRHTFGDSAHLDMDYIEAEIGYRE